MNKLLAVSGYIRAYDKDKGGNVIQTLLETDEMGKYIIDASGLGNELINHIDKRVVVIGSILHQNYMDFEMLIVKKFTIAED